MTHQRSPANAAQVVEEALGVVNGWMELAAGSQPLSIQVVPTQGAPVAGITEQNTPELN